MISLDQALHCYVTDLGVMPPERIDVSLASGRVLAADIHTRHDLPRFDQSAMDGYALAAGEHCSYRLIGAVQAGSQCASLTLRSGECLRIFTGAPVPSSAATVIPQELVTATAERIVLTTPYPAGRNIRRQGEELTAGSLLAPAGAHISPGLMAACITAGLSDVPARQQPRIAVLVSGNELRAPGARLQPGQVHDSNGPLMTGLLQQWGYACTAPVHVPDERVATRAALDAALEAADLVISSGGASVGQHDHLPAAAAELGLRQIFWKVAQKPGKPLYFGRRDDGKALLALPGNPAAVLVNMLLHVRTATRVLEGCSAPLPAWRYGVLSNHIETDSRRERLLRMHCRFDDNGRPILQPLGQQDSHMLSNLARANALVRVPCGDTQLPAGSLIAWLPL